MDAAPARPAVRWPTDEALAAALGPWIAQRRWFPSRGPAVPEPKLVARRDLAQDVRDLVFAVPRRGGGAPLLAHIPLVVDAPEALERYAVDGEAAGSQGLTVNLDDATAVALVDGPHHPAFWDAWARAAAAAGTTIGPDGVRAVARRAGSARVLTGEQSNTSVVLPAPPEGDETREDLIVKVFRVLAPGRNPDVEVSVALAHEGWEHVPRPAAWSTLSWIDPSTGREISADTAVASAFVRDAEDGFTLFCRLAATDDSEGPVRRRSEALAESLGSTTAQMHVFLARALGAGPAPEPAELAETLRRRAAWALEEVPHLATAVPRLSRRVEEVLGELASLTRLAPSTRIHGDYHLGQVLHASGGEGRWYVLDFEGEPLRPLAERRERDQPLRDVAGMLRSFDYAAAVGPAHDPSWLPAVRDAFLTGYTRAAPARPAHEERADVVVRSALELDKALYEAVYEARHRPHWVEIPLRGLRALLSTA